MEPASQRAAGVMRERLAEVRPAGFRAALVAVPPADRDAWVDAVLGLQEVADDGGALPQGCVPYLPCAVDVLLRAADQARIGPDDVVVDVGSGVGRAAAVLHLLSGATVVGVEIQPQLVAESRALAERLRLERVSFVEGDAVERPTAATVFFLYCPFSGERLARWLDALDRSKPLRLCCVDLPLPERAWLEKTPSAPGGLDVYRTR